MSFLLQPLQIIFAVLSESIRKEQEKVIEYLQLENQILREKLGGKRVLLHEDQRRLLAVKGKAVGRRQLGKIATIAQADTILRWHRELIQSNADSQASRKTGRPPTDEKIVQLVLRMARENSSWGYKRIEGALRNLGYTICSSTVANILKRHGIEPAPMRRQQLSWGTFLKAHLDVFEGLKLDAIISGLRELANHLISGVCPANSSPGETSVKSSEETPRSTAQPMRIFPVDDRPTQSTRAPPADIDAHSNIFPSYVCRAA